MKKGYDHDPRAEANERIRKAEFKEGLSLSQETGGIKSER